MKKYALYFKKTGLLILSMLLIFSFVLPSCGKDDDAAPPEPEPAVLHFEGTATPSSGSVTTTATGSVEATFDPATKKLSYTFSWSGLSGAIGGFHIHNGSGAIIIHFSDSEYPAAASGTFSGSSVLSENSNISDLKAGKLYGQIHTAAFPAGEIVFPFTAKSGSSGNNNDGGQDDGGNDDGYGGDGGY